ncbi:cyclic GMP-AMP synthase DncV-like nucleotidyltransferase [Marispirochaeta aestuarii]|uniref:cyclic GMP-AMP synthase DncV-like nucleotidyltransferase n=1 Tax=Marispirochaeta aestuarii TaxID=1963862 RepID=UPI0029C6E120|nr:hypothetical protein [Marispirochaeta aestuarii]
MYNYSNEIEKFWDEKVRLSKAFKDKLFAHRNANRDRLISRLPTKIEGLTVNDSSFKPQGSMAMRTIIQTKFSDDEYDIDDGLILNNDELVDDDGNELTTEEVRDCVLGCLKDDRLVKQPKLFTNCVRVYYSESDKEKHHVDFPIYRSFDNGEGTIQELANEEEWTESNPTRINSWFEDQISSRNAEIDGKGTQLRRLIQLLKRFVNSRQDWDLPNGLKITMLATECQDGCFDRIDKAFRELLIKLKARLEVSKVIRNLAHPDQPKITRTSSDTNVENFLDKISLALDKLEGLDEEDCDREKARRIWDWIFKSDGFFESMTEDSQKMNSFANKTPSKVVDHRGGGRFG